MGFQDYRGTPWAPWLLPIIPCDAQLKDTSGIQPENLGKIPGECTVATGKWTGFAGWTKIRLQDKQIPQILAVWSTWYPKGHETIGLATRLFPCVDADVNEEWQSQVVRDVASQVFGATCARGRSDGSPRMLLMFRLKQPGDFIPKFRRVYAGTDGVEFAVEILGNGQQCLIEGDHPKGGTYVWDTPPIEFGAENIPRISLQQLPDFIRQLDEAFKFCGVVPVKPKQLRGDGGGGPDATAITKDHPEVCSDLGELTHAMDYLRVTDEQFDGYDEWERISRAMKTACGGDETFYDLTYLPWQLENPDNDEQTIRAKWESHTDSKIGWRYVCDLAAANGYIPSVEGLFEPLEDDGEQGPDRLQSGRVGSSDGDADATPAKDGDAPRSNGPLRQIDAERTIADAFAAEHARKDWIYVPVSRTGGEWRQFVDGVWQSGEGISYSVGTLCESIAQQIRRKASATQAEKGRATYLTSSHGAEAVTNILRKHPKVITHRKELDQHDWLMGVPGGYVDRNGVLQKPDPGLLITKRAGCAPDRTVPCPRWDAAVWRLANDDADQYLSLRSALGYTLSGTGREQKFFFLYGHDAKEGKTSFLTCLHKVMGDYTHALPQGAFVAGRGSDNRFAFGGLEGCWYTYRGEVEENEEWASSALKDMTGSGMMSCERKGYDSINLPVKHALWFQGNHLPKFRKADDAGLRRRMIIYDCKIGTPQDDVTLEWATEVFRTEGPGVLAWLLDARYDYDHNGLYLPKALTQQTEDYLDSMDTMKQFVEDTFEFDAECWVENRKVYDLYRVWREFTAGLSGPCMGFIAFMRTLLAHPIMRQHGVAIRKQGWEDGRRPRRVLGIKVAKHEDDDSEGDEGHL